jgi:LmbE family N-acetylglucosaminyl deacetylase
MKRGTRLGLLLLCAALLTPFSFANGESDGADGGQQDWLPPCQKADLLVVSAHPDDELLYFGGTIPTYAGERGLKVQVAYMAHGNDDTRKIEAKNGLWLCGVKNEPVFLGFRDSYSKSLETAERQWGRDLVTKALVDLIRQFRPEVIVTHDLGGEYGHGAHRITASCMLDAVTQAADDSFYPDSLAAYGAWQVKKLYLHLYKENPVTMDWRQPLSAFQGQTALEIAQAAYNCHVSQLDYHQKVYDTGRYSSSEFGLAYTTVGPDEEKNDFFEHIDSKDLSTYVAPTPSPSPSPTPAPSPSPAPVPSPVPAETPGADPTLLGGNQAKVDSRNATISWAAAGIGSLLSLVLLKTLLKTGRRYKKRERRIRAALALVPALVALILMLFLF